MNFFLIRADELLLTEMIFNGLFANLTVEQCVALLSCFVFEEKSEMPQLAEELSGILKEMQVNSLNSYHRMKLNYAFENFRIWRDKLQE